MRRKTEWLIVIAALLSAAAGWHASRLLPSHRQSAVVDAAPVLPSALPELELPDLDGRPQPLSQWRGKLLLLNFWAGWCPPCVAEMPLLERMQGELGDRGLQIVGVAADAPAPTRDFLARHPVRYPILIDDPALGDLSRVLGNDRNVLPYSVLVDRDGRIVERHFGDFDEGRLKTWLAPYL
mgnify:CR=1 FL=1